MWFLECDGDLFQKKRIWLRPGAKHILGRTSKPEEGQRNAYIENGSVSRKHLTVDIDHVKEGDSLHLHTKTKITVTDNSKIGTWLNDERLEKGASKALERPDNKIKIGNYEHLFHIRWKPIVFSVTSLSRSARQQQDPLHEHRRFLEPLGIKLVTDYVSQYTTHAFVKKRNTATTLQALVNARYVVTEEYLHRCTAYLSADMLEKDFDANWAEEQQFSPPPGNEPNPRPNQSPDFLPNVERSEVFSQYTFIFNDSNQLTTLMPIITGGGGKALCRSIDQDTTVESVLEYVREVAGKKNNKSFNLRQQPKTKGGIIVVKIGAADDVLPGFYDKLDSSLGQVSIEQNELLEVILDVDASKLKRPAKIIESTEEDVHSVAGTEPPQAHEPSQRLSQAPSQHPSPPSQPVRSGTDAQSSSRDNSVPPTSQAAPSAVKRRGRRPLTQTKFKGFDEIDMSQLPKYRSPSPPRGPGHRTSQAPSIGVIDEVEEASQSQPSPSQPSQRFSRKRPAPVENEENNRDMLDNMLVGAAAMKKRRIEQERELSQTPVDAESAKKDETAPATTVKKSKKRQEKEIDVKAKIQEQRDAEEEARKRDEENMRDALDGMDVNELRDLVQIEEMDIVRKDPPPRSRYNTKIGHDERWDDQWNGRKNFKKFRRQGDSSHLPSRPRVFVQLEAVPTNSYGSKEEDYFLESQSSKKAKRRSQQSNSAVEVSATPASAARSQGASQRGTSQRATNNSVVISSDVEGSESDSDGNARFRRRIQASRAADAEEQRAERLYPEEIAGKPRDQELAAAARQAKSSASSRTQPGKRTGQGVVDSQSAAKKVQTRMRKPSPDELSEEDEEESTRFRRRKR